MKDAITSETISIWSMEPGKVLGFYGLPTEAEALAEAESSAKRLRRTYVVTRGSRVEGPFEVLKVFGDDTGMDEEQTKSAHESRIRGWLGEPPPGWSLPKNEPDPMKGHMLMISSPLSKRFMDGGEAWLTAPQLRTIGLPQDAEELEKFDLAKAQEGQYFLPVILRWKRRPEDYFIPSSIDG